MIYLIISLAATIGTILWVTGISYMHDKHPDYKGEDLFNEDEEIKQDGKIQKDN